MRPLKTYNKPVILLYEKEKSISRLVLGNAAVVCEIAFTDFEDAKTKLRAFLAPFKDPDRSAHLPPPLRP